MNPRIRAYERQQLLHGVRGEAVHALLERVITSCPDCIPLALSHPAACEEQVAELLCQIKPFWVELKSERVLTRWVLKAVVEVLQWLAERQPTAIHAERQLPEIRYGVNGWWAISPKFMDLDFLRADGVKVIAEVKTGRAGKSDHIRKMQAYALAFLAAEAQRGVHHRRVALRVLHLQYPAGPTGRILKVQRYTVTHGWARRWLARKQAVVTLPKEPWRQQAAA